MFCHQCGNAMSDGMRFCPKCGTAISQPIQSSENEQMVPETIVVPQKSIMVSWTLIYCIIGVIFCVVVWLILRPAGNTPTVKPSNGLTQEIIENLSVDSRKAKESTLRADISMIRNSLEQFQSDTGYYPNTLEDLVKISNPLGWDGTKSVDVATTYKGPYMRQQGGVGANEGIPCNPFINSSIPEIAGTSAPFSTTNPSTDAHWVYDHSAGKVWPNTVGRSIEYNINFSDF